jgi:hypothetical protein
MKPATPHEVATYGHIAAALRDFLAQSGISIPELSVRLGLDRGSATPYKWLGGKGAPAPKLRAKLAKVIGIPEAALRARKAGEAVPVSVPRIEGPHRAPQAGPTQPVLQFAVNDDGTARIRLDVSLPTAQAVPLLRLLLDAGMIVANAGG